MTVVVCVDEQGGILFNHRRVSSDRAAIGNLLEYIGDMPLYMSQYSSKLFPDVARICVCNDYLERAGGEDAVFLEETAPDAFWNKVQRLIVYRWNRLYPSDVQFPLEYLSGKCKLESSFDFAGNSHERITREVYVL